MITKKASVIVMIVLASFVYFVQDSTAQSTKENVKKYVFSTDWVSRNVTIWEKALQRFKGKPDVHYLEIGVFEGRSVIWMLENILTHRSARVTCIDIFSPHLKKKFLYNLRISGYAYKVTAITGKSQVKLKSLPPETFDFIYIDGSHEARDVLTDAVLCWPLLKINGVLIFDDYLFRKMTHPLELRPRIAIDAFITAFRNDVEVIYYGYQVILQKKWDMGGTLIGPYRYNWDEKKLYHSRTKEMIELSDTERGFIEQLFLKRGFGETKFTPDVQMDKNEKFNNLIKRLNLDFAD